MRNAQRLVTAAVSAVLVTTLVAPAGHARPTWDTSPVRVVKQPKPIPKVVDLRVGEHRNFDRIVIDFKAKMSGYKVRYVEKLVQDGSGNTVHVPGRRFVSIVLTPARTYNRDGDSIYNGPRRARANFETLRQAVFVSDFEGYVTFGLGLRRKEDFRVFVLHHPNRLVIDVRH